MDKPGHNKKYSESHQGRQCGVNQEKLAKHAGSIIGFGRRRLERGSGSVRLGQFEVVLVIELTAAFDLKDTDVT